MNFSGVSGQCRERTWNVIAKTRQAEHILTQLKHIQVSDVCVPVSNMGDLEQKPVKESCPEPSLSYANMWFPYLSPGHCSFTKTTPTYTLCLKITRWTWNSPWRKQCFPAIHTHRSGEETTSRKKMDASFFPVLIDAGATWMRFAPC